MAQLIDFSAALIEPAEIRNAGYTGVIGYFSESRPGTQFGAKPLRRDYCDQLRAEGLEIVTNYQFGKGDNADWRGGYDGGCRHAETALRLHFEAGGTGWRPLYAPVDDNPTLAEWNTLIVPFLRGWASVVGPEWTGVYCNARCIDWALEDGVGQWFWQHNWSGDPSINGHHPAAHLHQIEIDRRQIAGVGIDVNEILKPDYGQWSASQPPTPPEQPVRNPIAIEEDQTGISPNCNARGSAPVLWFLLHTQEGNGDARSLASYLQRASSGVSYHYTVDNSATVIDVVDTDLASWSVLNGNPRSINLCFAGSRAAWSRDEWLENMQAGIDCAAWIAVQDCRTYGIPIRIISPEQLGNDESGVADHNAYTLGKGEGSHTDVGADFPWDYLHTKLMEYAAVPAHV